jgi:NAD(P)-dependent dehydrogenase (short-subunit alcohol dehydrogenase family)
VQMFDGRTAVAIGAGSGGIATGIAEACARAGMRVVVADIDEQGAHDVAAAIVAAGGTATAMVVDATDRTSLAALRDRALATHGTVDLLSTNVGVVLGKSIEATTEQDWQWTLELNLMTVVRSVDVFLPALRAAGGDTHITFTSSMAGIMRPSLPDLALGAYAATKHALIGYGDALRAELAPEGIGVTVLCPGPVSTRLIETSAKHRPDRHGGSFVDDQPFPEGIDPHAVGDVLLRAVAADRFLALTHPDLGRFVERRYRAFAADFEFAAEGGTDGP